MAEILHIEATVTPQLSFSLRVAKEFLKTYHEANPHDTVRTLNLAMEALPDFDSRAASAKYHILHGKSYTNHEAGAWGVIEAVIQDFKKAKKLVISAPMWNFGIPYRLKQYIDIIVQPGYTFSYSPEEGYKGLVKGRPAMLILARGGEYAPGTDAAAMDFQRPYLESVLRFIGFENIQTIVIEPTLLGGPHVAEQKLKEAIALAREKAKTF